MQKIINTLALASFAVCGVAVAGGLYMYINKDTIVNNIKAQVMEQVTGGLTSGLPDLGGGLPIAGDVPLLGDGLPVMGGINTSSEEDEAGGVDRTLEGMDSATGAGPFPVADPALGANDINPFNKIML